MLILSTWQLIFLLSNAFVIGMLIAMAIRHARAHFHPPAVVVAPEKPHVTAATATLPAAVKERLLAAAEVKFQKVLDQSAAELQRDLTTTADRTARQIEKLSLTVTNHEAARYQATLESLRKQTAATLQTAQQEVSEHQTALTTELASKKAALEAELAEQIATEKQQLLAQIDTKLADAMASFLLETMQHNVDLGAQTAYLTSMLDEHKADFHNEVVS